MQTDPISDTGNAIRVMTLAAIAVESGRYNVGQYVRVAEWALWRYRSSPRKRLGYRIATDVLNGVIRARM